MILRILVFITIGVQLVSSITYNCEEVDNYYGPNCTFNNVVVNDIGSELSLSANYYSSYKYMIKFEESKLIEVPRKLFQIFTNIQLLFVANCQITTISRYTFEHASSMIFLNLSYNSISQIEDTVFTGATKLKYLDLSKNQIYEIREKAFFNIENLQILLLTNNLIKSLPGKVFSKLLLLKKISLAHNKLEILEDDLFKNCYNLEQIFLHNNSLLMIDPTLFDHLTSLDLLFLHSNQLHQIDLEKIHAKEVYLATNKLKTITLNTKLTRLYAPGNEISEVVVPENKTFVITSLLLSQNNITDITNITKLESLKSLDLSFNTIGALNLTTFTKLKELEDLDLESTQITSLEHGTFSQQHNILRLDISYNNLKEIDLDVFTSMSSLEEIFIDGNKLKEIDYIKLQHVFPELKTISVSDNEWSCPFLTNMIRNLTKSYVTIATNLKNNVLVTNKTNVKGIFCFSDKVGENAWKNPAKHLDKFFNANSTDEVIGKDVKNALKEVKDHIDDFNKNKDVLINKTDSIEKDLSEMHMRMIKTDNDIYQLKKDLIDIKMSILSNSTNHTYSSQSMKAMFEDLNNLTLQKQQLYGEKLDHKLYEQSFKIERISEKADENLKKLEVFMKSVASPVTLTTPTTDNGGNSHLTLIIFILIAVTINSAIILYAILRGRNYYQSLNTRYSTQSTLHTIVGHDDM